MRKKMKVILDYDDTLVECNEAALRRLNAELGTSYTLYDIKVWGVMNSDIDKRLKYYSDPEFMASLPLMEGAREFVEELQKRAEVFIMTSVESVCAAVRIAHIIQNFPTINPSNIIIGGRKDLVQADMILDDGHHNLENSNVAYPVLFQKPWNFGKTGVLSVNGYGEFLQLVDIIQNSQQKDKRHANVISLIGPTGAGKKELADKLVETGLFKRVKTYTTKDDSAEYNVLSFNDFTNRKDHGFFTETSIYMGEFFGMRKEDIDAIIAEGKKALVIVDINGAMSIQQHFNALNVFVKSKKEDCIKAILQRNFPIDESVQRITSLDYELRNEELCDVTATDTQTILFELGLL